MLHNLSKEQLEKIFIDLAKELKKRIKGKSFSYELIIVGGASILLNYSFRQSTIDIDCLDMNDALMNEVINEIGDKYNLQNGWINTDLIKTKSYSPKIIQYSSFYKSYSNGTLVIRTIKDEYLIAMKMVAARKYKHDYSDIYGILKENKQLSKDKVIKAIKDLYGENAAVSEEMSTFVDTLFASNSFSYEGLKSKEKETEIVMIEKYSRK